MPLRPFVVLSIISLASVARAAPVVHVELGPITGAPNDARDVLVEPGARRKAELHDIQDGREHNVRGVPLAELLASVAVPKAADTVIFVFKDGMRVPVRLRDKAEIAAIFIAFEHGDAVDVFDDRYPLRKPLHGVTDLPCPKVVYTKPDPARSIWWYPTELASLRLVTWKAYEAGLAAATKRLPSRSGWASYVRHCAACHGIGGQGATRGPDFLSQMEAYRRVPPFAVTPKDRPPSLHEKVKGFVDGAMPVLTQVPDREIAALWAWLHQIHAASVR